MMDRAIIESLIKYMDDKGRHEGTGWQCLISLLELMGCQEDEDKAFGTVRTLLLLFRDELLETLNGRS